MLVLQRLENPGNHSFLICHFSQNCDVIDSFDRLIRFHSTKNSLEHALFIKVPPKKIYLCTTVCVIHFASSNM